VRRGGEVKNQPICEIEATNLGSWLRKVGGGGARTANLEKWSWGIIPITLFRDGADRCWPVSHLLRIGDALLPMPSELPPR